MNYGKTFRLFVSSTFSDFSIERRLLQEYVFPEIKSYCKEFNLNFQPIDLRWGVTNEAQIDQKTLELCLEEVRASKINPHPNFLIMVSERYGWIPLPYLIEKSEYEIILANIEKKEDIEILNSWYKLDENHIPTSYILCERIDEFVDYENWEKVENQIRNILQNSVNQSSLSKEKKEKYFMSATEHEVVEGVFKYLKITTNQELILKNKQTFLELDYDHVYAYIRNIKSLVGQFKNNFIDKNFKNIDKFKAGIRKSINKNNIFEADANIEDISIDDNGSLLYKYETIKSEKDSIFVKIMIQNLKKSIDSYKNSISDLSQDNIERLEQKFFKDVKLKNFLGREEDLNNIDKYLNDNNCNEALILYGKSGNGKSSLIAKAIDNTKNLYRNKRVVYKFVGSTVNLTTTSEILISILKELGINENIRKVINPRTLLEENENIDVFYKRIHDHLKSLNEEIVIFIDGIDQVRNEDNFIWLPKNLSSNLKIVISVLYDENYKKYSKYFESIKDRTKNICQLQVFSQKNAKELVLKLLNQCNRTISNEQMDYLLNIFKNINSPLYLIVAIQELKNWKSTYKNFTLASKQKDLIKEFIDNLTIFYHHDKEFVKRVFVYISITDGLSESELLELLSSDKEFLNEIAPEKFHKNTTKELPIVIWSRLHTQIKEFLKLENIYGMSVMKFFYREFEDIVDYSKDDFEHLINTLEKIVIKQSHLPFNTNRWIRIFLNTIKKYYFTYERSYDEYIDYEEIFKYSEKIEEWNMTVLDYILKENNRFYELDDSEHMLKNYLDCLNFLSKYFWLITKYEQSHSLDLDANILLKKLKYESKWINYYLENLKKLSNYYYHVDDTMQLLTVQKEILTMYKISSQSNDIWYYDYIEQLERLAYNFEEYNMYDESVELKLETFYLIKDLVKQDKILWIEKYSSTLLSLHKQIKASGKYDEAIEILIEAFKILEDFYQNNKDKYLETYYKVSMNLADSLININKFDEAVKLKKKVSKIYEELYIENKNLYQLKYLDCLYSLSDILENTENYYESIDLQSKIIEILEFLFKENAYEYISKYSDALYRKSTLLRKVGNIEESINFENIAEHVFENLYKQNPYKYSSKYSESLRKRATILRKIGNIDKAIFFEEIAFKILKDLYKKDFSEWEDSYSRLFNLLDYPPHHIYLEEYIEEIKYGFTILEELFKDDPDYWIDIYSIQLDKIVSALTKINKNQVAKEFEKKLKNIPKIYKI